MANTIDNQDDLNVMLSNLRNKMDQSNALRDPIINKLYKIVEGINIDWEADKSSVVEQKLAAITKLDDLLKSKENAEVTKVKMSMQKRVDDASVDFKQQAIEVIKNIAPSAILSDSGFIATEIPEEEAIETLMKSKGLIAITDDEMAMTDLKPAEALADKPAEQK